MKVDELKPGTIYKFNTVDDKSGEIWYALFREFDDSRFVTNSSVCLGNNQVIYAHSFFGFFDIDVMLDIKEVSEKEKSLYNKWIEEYENQYEF